MRRWCGQWGEHSRCLPRCLRAKALSRRARLQTCWVSKIGRAHAELQSLMRISYAVFCLKKKKQNTVLYTYQYKNYKLADKLEYSHTISCNLVICMSLLLYTKIL